MITKAKLTLVGKVFAFFGFLALETVIGGWIGGKFGDWIGKSLLEVMDES